MLEFLEGGDKVYMQIEIFELGEGLKVLGDGDQSIVRKIEPN